MDDRSTIGSDRALSVPDVLGAAWIALVLPVVGAYGQAQGRPRLVLAIGVVLLAALLTLPARWWHARLAVATVAGFGLAALGQQMPLPFWLSASALLGLWVAVGRAPLPRVPAPGPGVVLPVGVLCSVAAWRAATVGGGWQVGVPLVSALVVTVLGSVGDGLLDRIGRRVGHVAATAVGAAVFAILFVVVVALPYGLQRLLGADPLRSPGRWSTRRRRHLLPRHPWAKDPAARHHGPSAPRVAAAALVVAALVGAWVWTEDRPSRDLVEPDRGSTEISVQLAEDMAWVFDERVALRPMDVYRLQDVSTRHVDIVDGDRRTWSSSDCDDCPTATLWLYGGATAFGVDQRDEHTVASALARLAGEDGIRLEVRNRGVPGQLHWRNALRFQWDLVHEGTPDLAVFLDGTEDLQTSVQLSERGLGDVRAPYESYLEDLYDEIYDVDEPRPAPDGVEALGWPTIAPAPDDAGSLAARRYLRSTELSRSAAERWEVPTVYAWATGDRPDDAPASWSSAAASARAALSDRVVAVTEADRRDAADASLLPGEVDAAALAAHLWPQVRSALGDPPGADGR